VLQEINISASKNLVRRFLDTLAVPGLVAAGALKVRPFAYNAWRWKYELTLIVAGAKRYDLKQGFREARPLYINSDAIVTPIRNLEHAVVNGLHWDEPARHHSQRRSEQRKEFYTWLLNMKVGDRLIRYGCDQQFVPSPVN
jgi:hypothetical protein